MQSNKDFLHRKFHICFIDFMSNYMNFINSNRVCACYTLKSIKMEDHGHIVFVLSGHLSIYKNSLNLTFIITFEGKKLRLSFLFLQK